MVISRCFRYTQSYAIAGHVDIIVVIIDYYHTPLILFSTHYVTTYYY